MNVFYQHQEESDLESNLEWIDIYLIGVKQKPKILISYFGRRLMHPNILFLQR